MAFNFNWSPLIADTSRARDMLTTALNKSPKPPIIVDDIIVNELNLGSVPPELEILEIGDLAEDRFRGIFRMSYSGDAFLTLKTRVQANPLNTYLSTRPSFASPQPLAAASGLTIPLQITLSDIRLSGFVVLVFSRQKGITLVFRNDPLESLKVSSTFDSIPFVRDYLQKEIEGQLRVLFVDDLPAIIHRLSLRLFVPEYQNADVNEGPDNSTARVDPLSSSPQDSVDAFGNPIESSPFALDSSSTETQASFSQKNLLRLAALTESQRTLSLFTPSIRDTVFRAWAGNSEHSSYRNGITSPTTLAASAFALSRGHSYAGSTASTPATFSQIQNDGASISSRPSFTSLASLQSGNYNGHSRTRPGRKRKNRVVNLRRNKDATPSSGIDISDTASVSTETSSNAASTSAPSWPLSDPSATIVEKEEKEGEVRTPPESPRKGVKFRSRSGLVVDESSKGERQRPATPNQKTAFDHQDIDATPKAPIPRPMSAPPLEETFSKPAPTIPIPSSSKPLLSSHQKSFHSHSSSNQLPSWLTARQPSSSNEFLQSSSGGILEQAWMMKMATEIARKVQYEKMAARRGQDVDSQGDAPPAYSS
ncbi:MAG: ERMES complex subunit [Bogoriella megaspora]|nr:MAG: ERMES complex subunit [Bogoriella megaspora]